MKPITLTIAAFGPYARETHLDFSDLGSWRLFVITGSTGSGKTTIFEAMLYALYGRLSKKGMDPTSLRCDFLSPEDDTVTQVDFTFEIGEKRYHIHRQPKQSVPKKRGSGRREIAQEAMLECVDNEDFLPLTKISEVDQKIVELLGLDEAQFKQIVMLPQGAFQEFLTSSTKDKSLLLRQIFDTSLYDQALQRIKSRVSDATGEYNEIKTVYQTLGKQLKFSPMPTLGEQPSQEALTNLLELQAEEAAEEAGLKEKVAVCSAAYNAANSYWNDEKRHNDDVYKWHRSEQDLALLTARAPQIDALQRRMTQAEQARAIIEKEARYLEEKAALQEQTQTLALARESLQQAEQVLAQAEEGLARTTTEKEACEKEAATIPTLTEKLNMMKDYNEEKQLLSQAEQSLAQADRALVALNKEAKKQQAATEVAEKRLREKQILNEQAACLEAECLRLQNTLTEERHQYQCLQQYLELAQARPALAEAVQLQERDFAAATEQLQRARTQNKQHLAYTLAQDLSEGEPCPVCGAIHHPAPTGGSESVDESPVLAQRDQAKDNLANAQAALLQLDDRLEEAWVVLQKLFPTISKCQDVTTVATDLQRDGVAHKEQMLQKQQVLQTLKDKLQMLSDAQSIRDASQQSLSALAEKRTTLTANQSRWQTVCDEKRRSIEDKAYRYGFNGVVDATPLATQIAEIEARTERAKHFYEQALSTRNKAKMALVRAMSEQNQVETRLNELQTRVQSYKQRFLAARDTAFANDADYEAAKSDQLQVTTFAEEITQYRDELTTAKALHNDLLERLGEDRTLHDVEAAEMRCQKAEQAQKTAIDALSTHRQRQIENQEIIEQIAALMTRFQTLETSYALLGQVRDVLDGKNHYNMRLETFAQTYYFEQMLINANARLVRMTHGRYSFKRKETVGDARKQAGLDLDVMDQYTGRARDISTLSGGESFKASLSLALGLADVVTSESGGVELSTIFIDEGFGTLDEESLDDTVETLISLQDSGRLVGVISHVAELKERIPAHLVVTGGTDGSRAHFEVRE